MFSVSFPQQVPMVSWDILWAQSSPHLRLALWLGRGIAVSSRRSSLDVMPTLRLTSWASFSMG